MQLSHWVQVLDRDTIRWHPALWNHLRGKQLVAKRESSQPQPTPFEVRNFLSAL
jgi:hypothetical protein